ncbi:MAG: ABC transporter permease [Halanaerobiaceae bacterium]
MKWYLLTFIFALFLNFYLPRLVPGNPVNTIISQMAAGGGLSSEAARDMYNTFMREFGLDQPVWMQFINYVKLLFRGDLGTSFSQYPKPVTRILVAALPWTIALQLPGMLVGWIVGNILGAIAAYRKGIFDKTVFPTTLFLNSIPHYALGIILLYSFAVVLGVFPVGGGYEQSLYPAFNLEFILSTLRHYVLPFSSIVLVTIGGQAIGMREMSIYELNEDYVLFSRSLGIKEKNIIRYVFKNAVLPQITGLALTLGLVVGGSLVTEIVFSYPGIGTYLFTAIRESDYPMIQGCTLLITMGVLSANFLMDLTYGFIDPRIKSAQVEEVAR